jgi:hypothetical protein
MEFAQCYTKVATLWENGLYPIKNLWNILKRCVERQVNKLVVKKSITIDIFQDIIQKEWERIELESFINLIKSMSLKLEQIIKGNGNN